MAVTVPPATVAVPCELAAVTLIASAGRVWVRVTPVCVLAPPLVTVNV